MTSKYDTTITFNDDGLFTVEIRLKVRARMASDPKEMEWTFAGKDVNVGEATQRAWNELCRWVMKHYPL